MGRCKPGLQMVKKEWQDLAPGECTFWRYHDEWGYHTVLVVACPKCGEPAEVGSEYLIVNRDGVQIHLVRPLTCPGDDCHAKYYCRVGKFEFAR